MLCPHIPVLTVLGKRLLCFLRQACKLDAAIFEKKLSAKRSIIKQLSKNVSHKSNVILKTFVIVTKKTILTKGKSNKFHTDHVLLFIYIF